MELAIFKKNILNLININIITKKNYNNQIIYIFDNSIKNYSYN